MRYLYRINFSTDGKPCVRESSGTGNPRVLIADMWEDILNMQGKDTTFTSFAIFNMV